MAEYFAGGHLRFLKGAWRDDNGDPVDVAPVVRCRDCKHFTEGMAMGMCKRDPLKPIMPMAYNNYCGFAERREGGK